MAYSIALAIVSLFSLFFWAGPVFALSPPIQISPINNSQVSSSKLTWETPSYPLYSNNPYRIQVDDDSDFSSIYRDYDTKNTYYKPVLTEGTWYWKVKAKDSDGTWSNWSDNWSFVLAAATPSPSPSLTPSPAPSPTANPTPTPKAKATSTPKTPSPASNPSTPQPAAQEVVVVSLPIAKASPKIEYRIASVAAAQATSTPSAKVEVKSQKQSNNFVWAGLLFIFAGTSLIGYIYLRKHANTPIQLRKRY